MSLSPVARQCTTQSQAIPTRRMVITSNSQLPQDYSSTPGGTLYSCTPGGTRIVYERAFLMQLRNSPLAKTPPTLQFIPGCSPTKVERPPSGLIMDNNNTTISTGDKLDKRRGPATAVTCEDQFEMDL